MKRVLGVWMTVLVVAACGGDGSVTSPVPLAPSPPLAAIGTDPVTGASLETDKDDYVPGEIVHLTGRGWTPGETVHLVMTEEPNTHADVVQDVVADSGGGFSIHFYDVQEHDLGVTFTLTGTGGTSGSVATVVFTDAIPVNSITVNGGASATVAPGASVNLLVSGNVNTGGGINTLASIKISVTQVVPIVGPVVQIYCHDVNPNVVRSSPGNTPYAQSFSVVSPTTPGTYNVTADAHITEACSGSGEATLVLSNGLVVQASNTAPTLNQIGDANGDLSVNEGSLLSFTATANDTDTPAQTLTFSLIGAPAGASITAGGAFTWTPDDGPSQSTSFTVRVTDNGTPNMWDEQTVNVTVNNVAPTATFVTPTSVNLNTPFPISLIAPVEPSTADVPGLQYAFDCGTGYGAYSGTSLTSCTATTVGAVTVKGKIKDKDGGESEYTASVAVNNVPPTSVPGGPYSGDEGSAVTVTGSGTDPDGGAVTYEWSVSAGPPSCVVAAHLPTSPTTTVTCNDNGSVTLSFKVTDDEGAETTNTVALNIANVVPVIGGYTLGANVDEGSSIPFQIAPVTDASSVDQAAPFEYAFACDGVNFGTWVSSNMTSCPAGDGPGSVTIAGKVRDKDFGESLVVSSDFTVLNVAPTATFGNNGPVDEGSSFTLSLTNPQDPSAADVAAGFTYAFDCGDGGGYGSYSTNSTATCSTNDNGIRAVKGKIKDKNDGEREYTADVSVNNVAPTATFGNTGPVDEGSPFSLSLTNPQDPSTVDLASLEYAFDCGSGYGAFGSASTANCATNDNGTRSVKGKVKDKDGGQTEYTASVEVNNVAPTATFGDTGPVNEGLPFSLSLTNPQDPSSVDLASLTYAFDCGDGTGYGTFSGTSTASCPTTDNGTRSVKGKVKDKDGGESEYTGSVSVNNVNPTVTSITVPLAPIQAGNPVTASWTFTDPGDDDPYKCEIAWDTPGAYDAAFTSTNTSPCSATKTLAAGVYTITVRVTDKDGGAGTLTATEYIVVYDPAAGFVTGGGWITSTPGSYVADPSATGKANFGFVSKYKKGQSTPDGNTEFQFHAGNLNFKSTLYQWLVVAGKRAQYKGEGTINGSGRYGFLLTAIDGHQPGGNGIDAFRIKIWDINNGGAIVYDNQMGAAEDSDNATALGGGSIVIHSK